MQHINQLLKDKWIEALRSGEYEQSRGGLHEEDGHCVLGVLDMVNNKITGRPLEPKQALRHRRSIFTLCETISGMPAGLLIKMNDTTRLTFPQIADKLEATNV